MNSWYDWGPSLIFTFVFRSLWNSLKCDVIQQIKNTVVLQIYFLWISGTQSQVHNAIDMIKQRFPPRQFPGITWEQLSIVESSPILPPEIMQVKTTMCINSPTRFSQFVFTCIVWGYTFLYIGLRCTNWKFSVDRKKRKASESYEPNT